MLETPETGIHKWEKNEMQMLRRGRSGEGEER